ncbi:hypothetical protein PVIIG_02843 [Plasmodium vivax India VII]|uniref:Uncharacterized protein n=6 Tax=Plasmodium vivax TaxID=5855 RepID=A5K6M0_PLAVS|nr:hypothetical protein, conserved [Plasmodium vivax]KMZ81416.1 hypothetical protein PVIIG_02843 [Plasmodium vivax India VII]KMZ93959.1 hypothetical protein PVMG_03126 [Plasmodium vivax Mauritania I]KNA00354.1 hypothetical protein PVNG_00988 [Plasmodium vivax North Korean]EDL44961.1 hypothetical protein, conserved [Plasmodium vivax]CAI7719594.1 ribonuclease H2 subunit C, putative [Plasmodium vivax]|eukprot:XP_001614688.1 hypothetical protein [Plasmodium vivax Sal-1]
MNSFFCEDTKEEEQLLQKIIKVKEDTLPGVILEILTNKCLSKRGPKGEQAKVKVEPHFSGDSLLRNETHDGWADQAQLAKKGEQKNVPPANYEMLNVQPAHRQLLSAPLDTNVFSFHLKKNGRVNADTFFIPYKSEKDEDVIREYTYSYSYYDVYSPSIERTNKLFHANNGPVCGAARGEEGMIHQKEVQIKQEKEDAEGEEDQLPPDGFAEWTIKQSETTEDETGGETPAEGLPLLTNEKLPCKAKNLEKFLVHFRGRLFIGCNLVYSHFKCKTFLGTIQGRELDEGETTTQGENDLHFVKKEIQTYNLIESATYWKQDEYPDVSDANVQKFLFLTVVPALCDYAEEEPADVLF